MTIYLGGNRLPAVPLYGHLQIVRAGRELEVQPSDGFLGEWTENSFWAFQNRSVNGTGAGGYSNTPGYGVWGLYAQVALDIGDRSDADVWRVLAAATAQFTAQMNLSIPYNAVAPAFNSNSFITTLLSIIGIEVAEYISGASPAEVFDPVTGSTLYFLGFPGAGNNALDYPEYSPDFRLFGGASNDIIRTGFGDDTINGGAGDDSLFGAAGNDSLNGTTGNDILDGGEGDDWLHGGVDADVLDGGLGSDTLDGAAGNDTLLGSDGSDTLTGGAGADLLDGGQAADRLDAGSGNDTLRFDEDDFIFGGAGRDVAYMSSFPQSVTEQAVAVRGFALNMDEAGIEVLVAPAAFLGVGGDTITGIGANDMVAAGGGDDVMVIDRTTGTGPTILWGGEGADTFDFLLGQDRGRPLGIMVVNVDNLTEGNFASFDRSMITVPEGFRWGMIDAIIINPDAGDRIMADGVLQGTSVQQHLITHQYRLRDGQEETQLVATRSYVAGSLDPDVPGGIAGNYDVRFLGGGVQEVFGAAATPYHVNFHRYESTEVEQAVTEAFGPRWWTGVLNPAEAQRVMASYGVDYLLEEHYVTNLNHVLAYTRGYGQAPAGRVIDGTPLGVPSIDALPAFTRADAFGPWFVLGGEFDGASLESLDRFRVTMPDAPLL